MDRLAQLLSREQLMRNGGRLYAKCLVRDLRADSGCLKQRPIAGVRQDESSADTAFDPGGK